MAKHAKPYVEGSEEIPYTIYVELTSYGEISVTASYLEEAMDLARDIVHDGKVLWKSTTAKLMPDVLIENHYQ